MEFTHLDTDEKQPSMVDIADKTVTERSATAESIIYLGESTLRTFEEAGWSCKKGPIFATAIIAGTMAAKNTANLIPFCHQLNLKSVKIIIKPIDSARLRVEGIVKVADQTGVEMEALTAVTVAALTLYDMCKSATKEIAIETTRLLQKSGGKSDYVHG